MPKFINSTGKPVKLYPRIIRFTGQQEFTLRRLALAADLSINQLVRDMIETECTVYKLRYPGADLS